MLDPKDPYDQKIFSLIKKSGFRTARSGFHITLIAQAKKSSERSKKARETGDFQGETGECISAILCSSAACESTISEFIEHETAFIGNKDERLLEIKSERSALLQMKKLLKYLNSNLDLSMSKDYQKLGCLFQLRDHISHRNARMLKVGEFPDKLAPYVKQNLIRSDWKKGVDWIDSISNYGTAIWAYETAKDWIELTKEVTHLED